MENNESTMNPTAEMSEEEKKKREEIRERIRQLEEKTKHRGCRRGRKLSDFLD